MHPNLKPYQLLLYYYCFIIDIIDTKFEPQINGEVLVWVKHERTAKYYYSADSNGNVLSKRQIDAKRLQRDTELPQRCKMTTERSNMTQKEIQNI